MSSRREEISGGIEPPGLMVWWSWMALLPALQLALFRFFVPERPDYAGHFFAGFGGTVLFVWMVARLCRGKPGALLMATLVCVGIGWLMEAMIFPLGGFDSVDFHSQSFGAALGGLALVELRAGDPEADSPDGVSPFTRNQAGRSVLVVGAVALLVGGALAFS